MMTNSPLDRPRRSRKVTASFANGNSGPPQNLLRSSEYVAVKQGGRGLTVRPPKSLICRMPWAGADTPSLLGAPRVSSGWERSLLENGEATPCRYVMDLPGIWVMVLAGKAAHGAAREGHRRTRARRPSRQHLRCPDQHQPRARDPRGAGADNDPDRP